MSAGGQLAAISAVACGAPALQPKQPATRNAAGSDPDEIAAANVSECVQGAAIWYGVFDMATEADQAQRAGAMSRDVADAPEWLLLGCFKDKCPADQIRSASPVSYVSHDSPPMLLLVGDADRTVPYYQTLQMDAALSKAGVKHDTHVYPHMDHSLLGTTLQSTRQVNQDALERTVRFIDATLGYEPGP